MEVTTREQSGQCASVQAEAAVLVRQWRPTELPPSALRRLYVLRANLARYRQADECCAQERQHYFVVIANKARYGPTAECRACARPVVGEASAR